MTYFGMVNTSFARTFSMTVLFRLTKALFACLNHCRAMGCMREATIVMKLDVDEAYLYVTRHRITGSHTGQQRSFPGRLDDLELNESVFLDNYPRQ